MDKANCNTGRTTGARSLCADIEPLANPTAPAAGLCRVAHRSEPGSGEPRPMTAATAAFTCFSISSGHIKSDVLHNGVQTPSGGHHERRINQAAAHDQESLSWRLDLGTPGAPQSLHRDHDFTLLLRPRDRELRLHQQPSGVAPGASRRAAQASPGLDSRAKRPRHRPTTRPHRRNGGHRWAEVATTPDTQFDHMTTSSRAGSACIRLASSAGAVVRRSSTRWNLASSHSSNAGATDTSAALTSSPGKSSASALTTTRIRLVSALTSLTCFEPVPVRWLHSNLKREISHLLHLSAYGDALESRLRVTKSLISPYTRVCVACVITCECNAYVQAVPA